MERTNQANNPQTPCLDLANPMLTETTVLVVDDERGPRESLRMILADDHRVLTAESGARALEILRTQPIDLVTVDLNMPGMKGDELIRTIRKEFSQVELIIITGCESTETAVEGLRLGVFDYLTKPFDVVQVMASVERAITRRTGRSRMVSFLEVLAETFESRDVFTQGHARRVAFYADLVAERLFLSREDRENLRIAALLHDIGKVGTTPDMLTDRPIAKSDRFTAVQGHAAIGDRLLRPLGLSTSIANAVRHHHERFDGTGYPDGLSGEDIPIDARIISLIDSFDAMTSGRPFQAARTQEAACDELRKEAGTQFDSNLVEIFVRLIETGASEAISDERIAAKLTLESERLEPSGEHNRGAA